jgi:hypothetical protein
MKTHIGAAILVAAVMAAVHSAHAVESRRHPGAKDAGTSRQEIRLERVTPAYWRVVREVGTATSNFDRDPAGLGCRRKSRKICLGLVGIGISETQ